MTQVFDSNGAVVPVTIIDLNGVCLAKKAENRVWIGLGKVKKPTQSLLGVYKDLGYVPQHVIETENSELAESPVGTAIDCTKFNDVKHLNITGSAKGKGFAGVVKRWNFAGGPATHGQSDRHRAPGSIGAGTTPGRVLKGKRMAGRMGGNNITVQNLKIVKVDSVNNLLYLKGAVPGANGSIVTLIVK